MHMHTMEFHTWCSLLGDYGCCLRILICSWKSIPLDIPIPYDGVNCTPDGFRLHFFIKPHQNLSPQEGGVQSILSRLTGLVRQWAKNLCLKDPELLDKSVQRSFFLRPMEQPAPKSYSSRLRRHPAFQSLPCRPRRQHALQSSPCKPRRWPVFLSFTSRLRSQSAIQRCSEFPQFPRLPKVKVPYTERHHLQVQWPIHWLSLLSPLGWPKMEATTPEPPPVVLVVAIVPDPLPMSKLESMSK